MDAALSIDCPSNPLEMENAQQNELDRPRCTLFNTWADSDPSLDPHHNNHSHISHSSSISVDGSPFQSILGISSLEVAMKNDYHGDSYPFIKTHYDTQDQVETFLDLTQATAMGQFMIVLILKLVMSPKLPLSAPDYGKDIEDGIQSFMSKYSNNMDTHGIPVLFFFIL